MRGTEGNRIPREGGGGVGTVGIVGIGLVMRGEVNLLCCRVQFSGWRLSNIINNSKELSTRRLLMDGLKKF
jgi:hypothetical protein